MASSSLSSTSTPVATVAIPHQQPQPRQPSIFEFTKRKRWAEILVADLPECIIFILSPEGKIMYCGKAVSEILGWNVDELIDIDFLRLINGDQNTLRNSLTTCMSSKKPSFMYARLMCKEKLIRQNNTTQHRELLFEIVGRPYQGSESGNCECVVLMARPYPSRNIAALNTFLELKLEKERLLQRRSDLRAELNSLAGNSTSAMSAKTISFYPKTAFYSSSSSAADDNASRSKASESSAESSTQREDEAIEDARKKRSRRTGSQNQHVCVQCGRTDSPEWRRGPNGPKTLCNACGLRWAKTDRRDAEPDQTSRRPTKYIT